MVKLYGLCVLIIGMLPTAALAVPTNAAPAPLIGAGLPVALALGGVVLASLAIKWFRRRSEG